MYEFGGKTFIYLVRENTKAGSKGRISLPKLGSKFGQSNNNIKHASIMIKFGT